MADDEEEVVGESTENATPGAPAKPDTSKRIKKAFGDMLSRQVEKSRNRAAGNDEGGAQQSNAAPSDDAGIGRYKPIFDLINGLYQKLFDAMMDAAAKAYEQSKGPDKNLNVDNEKDTPSLYQSNTKTPTSPTPGPYSNPTPTPATAAENTTDTPQGDDDFVPPPPPEEEREFGEEMDLADVPEPEEVYDEAPSLEDTASNEPDLTAPNPTQASPTQPDPQFDAVASKANAQTSPTPQVDNTPTPDIAPTSPTNTM